jgi:hypothetical protein
MTWKTVYRSTDQTIEQRIVGEGDKAVVEERVTWHRETPGRLIEQLRDKVADLEDRATNKITKGQLEAKLSGAKK